MSLQHLEKIRASLPDAARDLRLNLQTVITGGSLTPAQAWGTAVAGATFLREPELREAALCDARAAGVPDATIADAEAAAALMGMNTVYYRFRHLARKPVYDELPARLRMLRMSQTTGPKADFELFSLACSALAGCETCIRSHEENVTAAGISPTQVNDAIRIAATLQGVAIAMQLRTSATAEARPI